MGLTIIGLVIAAAAVAASVDQGEKSRAAGTKAARSQKQAQKAALHRSVNQERLAAQADAAANRKKPDVDALLFSERARAGQGQGSTILAGQDGGGDNTLLGRKSTLIGD